MINKAYKFRIYPNKRQVQQIEQTFGNCRFVYNYYLNKRIELYNSEKRSFNYYACANDLTQLKKSEDKSWLKLTDSTAYQNCLKDLQKAYDNFFNKSGFPKFKSKKSKQNYRSTNSNGATKIIDNRYIQLPKLDKVKCKFSRNVEGKILSTTISKNSSGKYFVSICCQLDDLIPFNKTGSVIGIDLGIKDFAITSNGIKYENPKYFSKSEKRLATLQRKLSRKSIGSSNRNKARIKVAKLHDHISNQRKDFLQKLSTELVKENDIICLETLKVKNMVKNHRLAKSISDCSWSKFVDVLSYKVGWYGKQISKIDTFFASSKTCSNCGYHFDNLTLSIRNWACPECCANHDRDVNAATNILTEGLRLLA